MLNPFRRAVSMMCFLLVASLVGMQPETRAAKATPEEIHLVEHSGDIFTGTIDIVTATDGVVAEYTVLTTEVLKGDVTVPSILVVRQQAGDSALGESNSPLVPGAEYLFFTYFDPALLRYVVAEPIAGTVLITSPEQRAALLAYWAGIIGQTACPVTDVLKLDGVVYARRDWNEETRYVARKRVGAAIATITVRDTTATGCRTDLADRSASVIPAGTKIQELKGYAYTFRVAVRLRDGNRTLYEAIWSEKATTGADLLDIRDRVTGLEAERRVECDVSAGCAADVRAISRRAAIDRVTELVLDAPVDRDRANWRTTPSNWVRLTFTLDDASTVTLWIDRESGWSQRGIRAPVDEIVQELWAR